MARSIIARCMNFPDARTHGYRDTDETGMRTRRRQEPGARSQEPDARASTYEPPGARVCPGRSPSGVATGERAREFTRDPCLHSRKIRRSRQADLIRSRLISPWPRLCWSQACRGRVAEMIWSGDRERRVLLAKLGAGRLGSTAPAMATAYSIKSDRKRPG